MEWSSLTGNLSKPLSASKSAETVRDSGDWNISGSRNNTNQLYHNGDSGSFCSQDAEWKQNHAFRTIWKREINILHWAGEKSLEIYMMHGLVLNILMPEVKPLFPSPEGYGYIFGNFIITLILCALFISLLSHNGLLKRILGMK